MITNENIDEVLKERYFEKIKIFFEKNCSEKARIEYVKKIYGIGGCGRGNKVDSIEQYHYDLKGMKFIKNFSKNKETLKMSWNKVVRRIEEIIKKESELQNINFKQLKLF
nr:MAG TPA: hypothetical protein [Caudoviricetes sp.]